MTTALWSAYYLVVGLLAAWTCCALWFFEPWPFALRATAALLAAAGAGAALLSLPGLWSGLAVLSATVMMAWLWTYHQPSLTRDWSPDQARLPVARFEDDVVHIDNFRHARYRDVDDYELEWQSRRFDLHKLRTVDFVLEHFSAWRGAAHTFLSFGFDNGEYLAISVEIRKRRGDSYSPFKGLFKRYEIMYVIGDERDLIGLRTHVRNNPVRIFPIRAEPAAIRALLVHMLLRANGLARQAEFYNTLTNTCSSNIVRHMEALSGRKYPWDLRVLLPGYADELAYELGFIDADGELDELRRRFHINPRAQWPEQGAGAGWSQQIRSLSP